MRGPQAYEFSLGVSFSVSTFYSYFVMEIPTATKSFTGFACDIIEN